MIFEFKAPAHIKFAVFLAPVIDKSIQVTSKCTQKIGACCFDCFSPYINFLG